MAKSPASLEPRFTSREFEIFSLPDFETRMPAIRAEITPRLKALGEALTPAVCEMTGREIFPHVAMHMRRTVNPPIETWAAFSPSARAYKPFTHFRVAINGEGLKFVCHLEEDSDEKESFAANLKRDAKSLAAHLATHPEIRLLVPRGVLDGPAPEAARDAKALVALAQRLATVKAQDASFSIALRRDDPAAANAKQLVEVALDAMRRLLPFYRLGTARDA